MDKADNLSKYFLALVPPAPAYDEALRLKHYFKEHFNSKAALNSPPHITLHMPFQWKQEKENDLVTKLSSFSKDYAPLRISMDSFGSFPPRVIFIHVLKTPELENFQKALKRFCRTQLNLLNSDYKDQPFHPHLTLAFRDLRKAMYPQAWAEFREKEFKAEFLADKFTLLKHNGKVWEVFREFLLPNSRR